MFCRILISRLIFFFLTGLRILTTHFVLVLILAPSNTCHDVTDEWMHFCVSKKVYRDKYKI